MRTLSTDVAIIGAGTAGMNARREVERAGKRHVLIESGPYGTTCARTGCMPSKLLIAAAEAVHSARRAPVFGVNIAPEAIRVDGQAVLERVRSERDRFVGYNARPLEELAPELKVHGRARFVGPNELAVDDHTRVHAQAIVIATGSTPIVPDLLAPLGDRLLTTDSLFELNSLPASLAVFGTGAIGLELGQALAHLGVRVTFYNPFDALGSFTDPVIDARFRELLGAELDLALGAEQLAIEEQTDGVVVRHRDPRGVQHERHFELVLAAVGRRPQLADLDLAAAGLVLDDRGMPHFSRETSQCGDAPIFIAGDVDGFRTILHEASDEGRMAGANAASYPQLSKHVRRVPLNIGFTTPQLAMVGKTHKEASASELAIGEVSFENQGRARVLAQNQGHLRLYATRCDKVLVGAELFAPAAEHLAHLLAWSIQQELTIDALLRLPVYHPTLEEGLRTALRDAARQLDLLAGCPPEDRGESPAD